MIRLLTALVTALSVGPALAANIDPRLAKADVCGRYEIFHINGIQTIEPDAWENLEELGIAYGNAHNEHLIVYWLAYNPTQGALLDLADVFAQKLHEYPGATFAMIVRAVLGRVRHPLPRALAEELQRILIERVRDTGYVSLYDADLARVVHQIRQGRASGAKTLLVPHSQGNLYANSAYALLTQGTAAVPAKSLAIVGVASPAAFVAGANGRYVTSRQDLVIQGLRRLLGGRAVLPGNVTQPITADDHLGHNFVQIYLRPGTNARTRLLQHIEASFDALRTDRADPSLNWVDYVIRSQGLWVPEVEPYPPLACEAIPASVHWSDSWSSPPQVSHHVQPGPRSDLESRVKANAQACYEKGLQLRRRLKLLPPNQPFPPDLNMRCIVTAWNVYSADFQVTHYREFPTTPDGRYVNYQLCGIGIGRQYIVYGATHGDALIAPGCRRE